MDEEVAGWISFTVALVIAAVGLVYLNTTIWHHEVAYRRSHPLSGWRVGLGTIESVGRTDFSQSPPQTPGVLRFVDYYGHNQTTDRLHFEVYPISPGTSTEVDVSKDGSVYVPRAFEYDYNHDNSPETWGGPRAASNTSVLVRSFVLVCVAVVLGSLLWAVLEGSHLPRLPAIRGRLGVR